MNNWIIVLALLALIQIRVFRWSWPQFKKSVWLHGASLLLTCLAAEGLSIASQEFNFEWWSGVVVMFTAFIIAEAIFYSKNKTAKLSVHAFSTVWIGFGWLSYSDSLSEWNVLFSSFLISALSLLVSFAFINIAEKIELSDVAKNFKEIPIFLISAAVLVLVFVFFSGNPRSF